jgi:hypothetical protein
MGRHDIEDAVDWTIEFLANSPRSKELDCRSIFHGLYAFQDEYDTGFTHFRGIHRLVAHRFVYVFDVAEHPDYERCRANLEEKPEAQWVYRDPSRPWDGKDNPEVGYIFDTTFLDYEEVKRAVPPNCVGRKLYCDAGSELWRRFVELGRLSGADALEPRAMPIDEIVATVVREAERQGNREIIRVWFSMLFWHMEGVPLAKLRENPFVRELRAAAKRTEAAWLQSQNIPDDWGWFHIPVPEDSYIPAHSLWWFDLETDVP